MDETAYENEIVPHIETLQTVLHNAGLHHLILIMLDDENVEYRNSPLPEGVKHLSITVFRDKSTEVVPVFDESMSPEVLGRLIEGSANGDISFHGKAVQFGEIPETGE